MKGKALIFFVLPLLLLGVGCKQADEATAPIEAPLDALEQAQELSVEVQAQQRRQADTVTNLLPVALVLTEGAAEPTEGVERLAAADDTFGCLERIGYVRVSRETATDDVVLDALNTLFSLREPQVQGMLNPLWESTMTVDRIEGDGVKAKVYLTGELMAIGTCSYPRLKEQIEATVRQYRPEYEIILNGDEANWRCFGDMSGMCE